MSEIEIWIEEAVRNGEADFRKLSSIAAAEIVRLVKSKYVKGDPRVWWLSLKAPSFAVSSVGVDFVDVVPGSLEKVYLIPETDDERLPVYQGGPADIDFIRRECPPFEYYVTDESFEWLVIETDHDEFITAKY